MRKDLQNLVGQQSLLLSLAVALLISACSLEQADPKLASSKGPENGLETYPQRISDTGSDSHSENSESVGAGKAVSVPPRDWQAFDRCPDSATQDPVISVHCGSTASYALDAAQRLHVIFEQDDRVYYSFSESLGERYSEPVAVNAEPEALYSRGENRPKLALGTGGEIYASWSKKTEGRFNGDIRFSRSVDEGRSFSPPYTVNDDNLLTTHRFDQLSVDRSGNVFLSWIDKRDRVRVREAGGEYTGAAIYYAVSENRGQSFGKNRKLADYSCECCRIAMLPGAERDGVTLLWRHIFPESIRDHAIAELRTASLSSAASDASGSAGAKTTRSDGSIPVITRATIDDWKLDACPHHGPAIAASSDDQDAHMVWFTNGSIRNGISYGRYNRESSSTHHITPVDSEANASHADIASSGNDVYVVWKKEASDSTRIMLTTSRDDGLTWQIPTELDKTTGGSDYPFLLTQDRQVYLAWKTDDQLRLQNVSSADQGKQEAAGQSASIFLKPFNRGSLKTIETGLSSAPHMVMFWSVDCAPCLKDLALLNELQRDYGTLPVTLIATDGTEFSDDIIELAQEFDLHGNDHWVANISLDQMRMVVDPDWYGELPRTYLYKQGQRLGRSGTFQREQLIEWLGLMSASPVVQG
ncbi:MAG: hypothetical protein AAF098_10820 [Pseudomonadota bacterium]